MHRDASAIAAAKAGMSRARALARKADPLSATLYDRWYAETLMSAPGVRAEAACAMLTPHGNRIEVMADRRGWPAGKVVGVNAWATRYASATSHTRFASAPRAAHCG